MQKNIIEQPYQFKTNWMQKYIHYIKHAWVNFIFLYPNAKNQKRFFLKIKNISSTLAYFENFPSFLVRVEEHKL